MEKYIHTPNLFVTTADGVRVAYRDYGKKEGTPIVMFVHLAANLDNWRPELLDLLAQEFRVIVFDYRSVGLSEGERQLTVHRCIAFGQSASIRLFYGRFRGAGTHSSCS
jgi:alpha/beta hydrolase, putative